MTNLLTVEEAAAALHATVTVAAIRAAIREGRLAATRIGKRYYVEERVLRRFACHAPESRPASGAAPAMAPGSSLTGASSIGQAIAERAAADLLKMRSKSTSPPSGKKAAAGQRSPTR